MMFFVVMEYRSKVHGFGLFATERIDKGTYICEYTGEIIDNGTANKREIINRQNVS